jgi:hypothetical protein
MQTASTLQLGSTFTDINSFLSDRAPKCAIAGVFCGVQELGDEMLEIIAEGFAEYIAVVIQQLN